MALVVGVNSYVTVQEADDYCADRYGYDAWATASDKDKALISAADILDGLCVWKGLPSEDDQVLEFPRDISDNVVPQAVKDAQCEVAFSIINLGSTSTDGGDALEELKAGSVSMKFKAHSTKNPLVNSTVLSFLQPYGFCAAGGTKIIPIQRG